MKKYILVIDQGTSSSRIVLYNKKFKIYDLVQKEFKQFFPKDGWVEHNPKEIWNDVKYLIKKILKKNNLKAVNIISIGITNQRETTVLWNKINGKPVYNAIVWQDRRTAKYCNKIKKNKAKKIQKITGLEIDPYFSATKIKWILENKKLAKDTLRKNNLLFGTIDTWLLWNLTEGKSHLTDITNASRTMIFDSKKEKWSDDLLKLFKIPKKILPMVKENSYNFGTTILFGGKIEIGGMAGDQQSATIGQACFTKGQSKSTYGTGCFLLMNIGDKFKLSKNGLLTTIACTTKNSINYAFEGSVFIGGAAIQWLRDSLKLIKKASETERISKEIDELNNLYMVPSFSGLGAPYWDMYSRGAIFGLTRDTGNKEIIKATLESLAYQSKDVIDVMIKDSNTNLNSLSVDGGACLNNYLMQFQSNLLGCEVVRPKIIETTAMGVGYLAGIKSSLWDKDKIISNQKIDQIFKSKINQEKRKKMYSGWLKAIERTKNWLD